MNTPADNRPGSVGRLLPHLRALISAAGEIRQALGKGPA